MGDEDGPELRLTEGVASQSAQKRGIAKASGIFVTMMCLAALGNAATSQGDASGFPGAEAEDRGLLRGQGIFGAFALELQIDFEKPLSGGGENLRVHLQKLRRLSTRAEGKWRRRRVADRLDPEIIDEFLKPAEGFVSGGLEEIPVLHEPLGTRAEHLLGEMACRFEISGLEEKRASDLLRTMRVFVQIDAVS
jgi:hypothetical protein